MSSSCALFRHALFVIVWLSITSANARAATADCTSLKSLTIPSTAIGLPSRGAIIRSADALVAAKRSVAANGAVTPATPDFCRVIGTIAPIDAAAPPITFQVNLPTVWNGKALQYGGGGFNGTLITAIGPALDAPPDAPTPLTLGYVTLGTDSGHQGGSLAEPQAFALNDEALENFAYASYKKVHDVAVAIILQLYGRRPVRFYYMGSSEGGREGLSMAQRFPADFDGIISRVPVINWTGLQHVGHRSGLLQQGGGWLSPSKVRLLNNAVLNACDALDGLADGIVGNYRACSVAFSAKTLRCPNGSDDGDTCLSDRQLQAIDTMHSPFTFPFAVADNVRAYPGFGYGGEAQPGGFPAWVTATTPAAFPSPTASGQPMQWIFGNGAIRYFILRDANADPFTYAPDLHADRIKHISALMDAMNPDLSAFAARGGKLIVKEHMADYAQSPFAGIGYYQSVVAKLGETATNRFVRLYLAPGANHGGSGVSGTTGDAIPQYVDLLGALDQWVERNTPPQDLVQTSVTLAAARPLCEFPKFPKYRGTGDPKIAASFTCEVP